ncbi:diaminopimelate decarboxylase [Corynebacterium renale]|uniref:Diaminopimelate decarboxylase n=1 Tax=Corynebacterium renale TaxID=1724 RepID=A0A2A9DQR3_9CORY|nr:diaminopimelate decarboxylase [Corynebacterium renale]PFG28924.1 diaminopimelate decarboxylase [Corynebacterium renale]SQI25557.1 diaminopimelate decarboxylase [Corynebacterium renale]
MDSTVDYESFNDLPAHVWPKHTCRQEDGVITIADVPLPEIAEKFGTPTYVVDEADFRFRCRSMAQAFGGADHVHYAAKAFLTRTIAGWVEEEGLSLDVASVNELLIAAAADFPAARITVHGNNKTPVFLRECVSRKVGHVVLDSPQEIEDLAAIAAEAGHVQPVLIRVTPGIEAHTHEFIATSHEDQKFGISLAAGDALDAVKAVLAHDSLRLEGLHCHVGSQVFDAEGFGLAAERILGFLGEILDTCGPNFPGGREALATQLSILDLGGGYGIAYTAQQQPLDVAAVADDLLGRVAQAASDYGIAMPHVMVEPGRAIAGPSTATVYTVGTIKDVPVGDGQRRRYISVDGGMSDNIRPALYGAEYDFRVASGFVEGEPVEARIVGSHCESGDILIHDIEVPEGLKSGDIVGIPATGAYGFTMSSRYNAFGRPAVVVVNNGHAELMVRRETVEDILALEEGN